MGTAQRDAINRKKKAAWGGSKGFMSRGRGKREEEEMVKAQIRSNP